MLTALQRKEVVETIRAYEQTVLRIVTKDNDGKDSKSAKAIESFAEGLIEHFQPPMARLDIIRGEDIALD